MRSEEFYYHIIRTFISECTDFNYGCRISLFNNSTEYRGREILVSIIHSSYSLMLDWLYFIHRFIKSWMGTRVIDLVDSITCKRLYVMPVKSF